jgi:hypothetical protein
MEMTFHVLNNRDQEAEENQNRKGEGIRTSIICGYPSAHSDISRLSN